jgi:hypothetical protein
LVLVCCANISFEALSLKVSSKNFFDYLKPALYFLGMICTEPNSGFMLQKFILETM